MRPCVDKQRRGAHGEGAVAEIMERGLTRGSVFLLMICVDCSIHDAPVC